MKPQDDMEETEMHVAKWKKPVWKGYILHYSNYMTFWKGKTIQIVKILVVSEGLVGEMQILGWGKAILCDTIIVDSWCYAFVKTHKILQHKFLMNKN